MTYFNSSRIYHIALFITFIVLVCSPVKSQQLLTNLITSSSHFSSSFNSQDYYGEVGVVGNQFIWERKTEYFNKNEFEIKIFPNPTSDFITIKSNMNQILNVSFYTEIGAELKQFSKIKTPSKIDLTTIPNGILIAKIKDEKGKVILTRKIIKI